MVQAAAVLVVSQAKLEQAIGAVQTSQAELALEKGTKLDLQRQHVVAAYAALQQRLDTAELDRENGRNHSSSLQAQVDALQNQLNQVQGYHNQATKDLQTMQQQNTAERVRSTERWEETLLKQVQQMQAALLKQKSEITQACNDRVDEITQQSKQVEGRVASLTLEQREASVQLQAEQAKLVATQQRLQECEAGMLDLTAHLQKAHSEAADELKARTTLQQSLTAAELERDQEREQSASLQAQVDALQDQVNQVKGYHNQAAANSQAEQAKLVATQQRLQECEAGMLDLTGHLQKAHSDAADDLKEKQVAFAELQHKYEGSEKRNVKLVSQLQDAEATADQPQLVELRLSQQQCTESDVKQAAVTQEAERCTTSQLETHAAPGKKKKKQGKKQAKGGQQHQHAGQVNNPDNAAMAHKAPQMVGSMFGPRLAHFRSPASPDATSDIRPEVVDSNASPDSSQTALLNLQSQLTKLQELPQVASLHWDDSWVIQHEVGRGGSGVVSRCTSPNYPDVVVKKGALFRLQEEARMMQMLNHPNVARAFAVLSSNESTYEDGVIGYLALGRLGRSLIDMLPGPNARPSIKQLVVGFQGVAAGLAHIHSRGMVDQDVHEGNVLETLDGKAWVKADLGNAAWLQQDGCPTKVFDCRCAASREAPEVADSLLQHGWYEPQCSSDMWALGLLMVLMVQGSIPEAQRRLQRTEAYRKGQREGSLRLATSQAQRDHLEYLADLLQGDSAAYAAQVNLAALVHPKALPMKQAILGCLQVQPQKRLTAKEVQVALHKMMQDNAWT